MILFNKLVEPMALLPPAVHELKDLSPVTLDELIDPPLVGRITPMKSMV